MSARAAIVASELLVEVFDHVPEYTDYDCPDVVQSSESDYRISMGRVAKSWGDQLLGLAEHPGAPLTRAEMRAVDTLLARISEMFHELNQFESARLTASESKRREALRRFDGDILSLLEQNATLMGDLSLPRGPSLWLQDHAAEVIRRLRRLTRKLEQRNDILHDQRTGRERNDVEILSGERQ